VRLRTRKSRIWSRGFLAHRYLWRNLEAAVTEAKRQLPSDSRIVLDVGCGNKPYADLFSDCLYIGANYMPHQSGWGAFLPFNVLGIILDKVSSHASLPANYTVLARS
jgi:hypothetical protein